MEVNDGFCRLTGYRADEAIGLTLYQIGIWADENQRAALLAELQIKGRIHHLEMLWHNKRGEVLAVEVSVEPITLNETPCLLLTARDVSLLKNAQAQIRHLPELLADFVRQHPNISVDQQELTSLRIKVVLRRAQSFPQRARVDEATYVRFDEWRLDTRARQVLSLSNTWLSKKSRLNGRLGCCNSKRSTR